MVSRLSASQEFGPFPNPFLSIFVMQLFFMFIYCIYWEFKIIGK